MSKLSFPADELNQLIDNNLIIGKTLDMKILEKAGMFILKDYFDKASIENYYNAYIKYKDTPEFDRTRFHLTEVRVKDDNPLFNILNDLKFLELISNLFNGNVGLFNLRIVKKDKNDTLPVFLHQDLGYQAGRFERYSLFIPLTYCGIKNGGLKFYPGTQNFGYLGDAGALNDFLPDNYPRVTPEAFPGDVIIMHSAVWHSSDENTSLADRIYYDIHVQDANDPSTKKVLTGERSSPWQLTLTHDEIFQSSRTQRLKELYSQINS